MQNQPNTGSQGGQKFVDRFEMAIMQYVILNKAQQGEVTRDSLQQTFKGNLQMGGQHFDHCITTLVKENHLKDAGGNKYTITDDGREDIQKLQHLVLELPNVVNQGKGREKQPTAAGVGGTAQGNTGNVGQQNIGQPKGGPGSSSR